MEIRGRKFTGLRAVRRRIRSGLIQIVVALLKRLPLKWVTEFGSFVGTLGFHLARRERRRALAHVAIAFPQESPEQHADLVRRCFRHFGRTLGEEVRLWGGGIADERWVEWPAEERAALDRALQRGRGVIFATAHLGNWELLARHVARSGYAASTVARTSSDPRLTEMIQSSRARSGLQVIWRGALSAPRDMLRALRGNRILGLLIDQDTRVQSVWVPFFGRLAKTPTAAAKLALRTEAAAFVGFAIRTGPQRYRLSCREVPLPEDRTERGVEELTARFTAEIEAAIRSAPEQWVWFHERWRTLPPAQKAADQKSQV